MRIVKEGLRFIEEAGKVALNSTCLRSKCGCVIVKDGSIIGSGFNSPACESQRRCNNSKSDYDVKVTDKTCCVHAEQRAIMDGLRKGNYLKGSTLYFVRLVDDKISYAGEPYCTICSKMALDVGIKYFVLFRKEGICVWDTEDYNDVSYAYKSLNK